LQVEKHFRFPHSEEMEQALVYSVPVVFFLEFFLLRLILSSNNLLFRYHQEDVLFFVLSCGAYIERPLCHSLHRSELYSAFCEW